MKKRMIYISAVLGALVALYLLSLSGCAKSSSNSSSGTSFFPTLSL